MSATTRATLLASRAMPGSMRLDGALSTPRTSSACSASSSTPRRAGTANDASSSKPSTPPRGPTRATSRRTCPAGRNASMTGSIVPEASWKTASRNNKLGLVCRPHQLLPLVAQPVPSPDEEADGRQRVPSRPQDRDAPLQSPRPSEPCPYISLPYACGRASTRSAAPTCEAFRREYNEERPHSATGNNPRWS